MVWIVSCSNTAWRGGTIPVFCCPGAGCAAGAAGVVQMLVMLTDVAGNAKLQFTGPWNTLLFPMLPIVAVWWKDPSS